MSLSIQPGGEDKRNLYNWIVPICGVDADGNPVLAKVDASGRLLTAPQGGSTTDRSGTITAGGTAQQAAAANTSRRWLFFQNVSDEVMWIDFGAEAVADQPSIKVAAGSAYENPPHFCPTGAVSVIGATTGKAFTCKEA